MGLGFAGDDDGQIDISAAQRSPARLTVGPGISRCAVESVHGDIASGEMVLADEPETENPRTLDSVEKFGEEVLDDALVRTRRDDGDPGSLPGEELHVEGSEFIQTAVGGPACLVASLVELERRGLVTGPSHLPAVARTDRWVDGHGQVVSDREGAVPPQARTDADRSS